MPFATAAVLVPTLMPAEPVELVATLDRRMASPELDVSLLPNAALLEANAKVELVSSTDSTVTLRVTVERGLAGSAVVFVLCQQKTGPPPSSGGGAHGSQEATGPSR